MKYKPEIEDQVAYADENYFVIWRHGNPNLLMYRADTFEHKRSILEYYCVNLSSACTTAEEMMAIQYEDD